MRLKGDIFPEEGGCWYCHNEDKELMFCWEFDTWVHLDCIRDNLTEHPDDLEGLIIAREFCAELGLDEDEIQARIDALLGEGE